MDPVGAKSLPKDMRGIAKYKATGCRARRILHLNYPGHDINISVPSQKTQDFCYALLECSRICGVGGKGGLIAG